MDRIDALRLYLDVADAGSFSKVARQRVIATSTVALAVSQLEQELGARFIIRSTRKLVFTHEGERLLEDARRIVSDWDAAVTGLREDGPLTGPIRVSVTNDFGRRFLRPLLDAFQDDQPGIHVTLLLSDATLDLVEERIDLALRNGPLPDSTLRARLLIRGPRLVCASPGYWARHGKPKRPEDLAHHNCVILARPGAPLTAWPFRADDKPFTVKVRGDRQASDGDLMREWALAGRGVVIKNLWEIRADLEAGTLETALDEYVAGQVDLYAVTPGPPSRRSAALVNFLAERLR
ncbi:LysR substrate-binding domain-containing protein [uncultured Enterovirga sp.]|uniref:LysR family transcriptional regulator n=1 Tax=uncultured Enterovirga sp. TaxID=2026352 RepID=UPI0035C9C6F4